MTEYLHQLLEWVSLHPVWSGFTVFLIAMAESLAIVGLLVPGVALMFGFGALISAGAMEFWPTLAWAVAGAVAGDGLSFFLGRRCRDRLTTLWPFSRHPRSLERGMDFFHRYGGKSVIIGRFVGPIRAIIPLVAGMLGMPPKRFVIANLVSALIWAPAYLLPGMILGASLELASEVALGLVLLLLILVALVWFVIWIVRQIFRLLQPHATTWLRAVLNWSRLHPKLGEIAAALADPHHPEAGGLAILASLLILTTGLFTLIFGAVLGGNSLAGVDQTVLQAMQSLRTPWADHLMAYFSRLADIPVVIPLLLGVFGFLAWHRHWRTAGYLLAAMAFGLLTPVILKYTLQIPRPDTGISGLGPYGFPSGHVLRATVLFGFLSVIIARPLPTRHRWLPYSLAGLLIAPVAIARLYLGAHWLSDVLASLSLGLAWVALLGIAYHRHTLVETRWRGLATGAIILLVTSFSLQTWHGHTTDLVRYTPARPQTVITIRDWWNQEWSQLPWSRLDMRRRHTHPLQLQYAGTLKRLQTYLQGKGWKPVSELAWVDSMKLLSPSLTLKELPVLPQVHDGRHEALALVKSMPDDQRLVLRLWPSDVVLTPNHIALWLGSVSSQRQARILNLLTFPETIPDFHRPFEILRRDIVDLNHRRPDPLADLLLFQLDD